MIGFETIIGKAAANGAGRAAGWGWKRYRNSKADAQFLSYMQDTPSHTQVIDLWESLGDSARKLTTEFLASPIVEQTAAALAVERLQRGPGATSTDSSVDVIRQQFEMALRVALLESGTLLPKELSDYFFEYVDGATTFALSHPFDIGQPGVGSTGRGAMARLAAGVAAAAVRNLELLQDSSRISVYKLFASDLRRQVSQLHGSMRIPHAATSRQVPYERLFVSPIVASKRHADEPPIKSDNTSLDEFARCSMRVLLLGDPGGGKSTASLKLAYDVSTNSPLTPTVPLFIVLRDYVEQFVTSRISIVEWMERICGNPYGVAPPAGAIEYLLLNGHAFVVFDGLDELLDTSLRRDVVQAVEGFTYRFPLTQVLVTSRRVGYDEAPLNPDLFVTLELKEFSESQVLEYARNWFGLDESLEQGRAAQLVETFMSDSAFVPDLRMNPLLLSLMCGIYASEHYIPRNRPDVYEKCALLLFERWDKQRGIKAPLSFDAHVQAAMRSLALWLYPKQEAQKGLPRGELIRYMTAYLLKKRFEDADEAEEAATEFIDFCKGRAWVLTDVGAELYGFTHRTFLEYFAASQLVRENASATGLLAVLLPRIQKAEWDVVAQLAVQILGRAVEDGADDFLKGLVNTLRVSSDVGDVRRGASFATRALSFIVPRPEVLREIVTLAVDTECEYRPAHPFSFSEKRRSLDTILDLSLVSLENIPLMLKCLRESLAKRLREDPLDETALANAILFEGRVGMRQDEGWMRFPQDNWTEFSSQIALQSEKFSWVAVECVLKGALPVAELLRRFGVRACYDFRQGGYIASPPLAYRVLGSRQMFHWGISEELGTELFAALVDAPVPWLQHDPIYSDLNYIPAFIRDNDAPVTKIYRSLVALALAPLLELREDVSVPRRFTALGAEVLRICGDRRRTARKLESLNLESRAEALLREWISGEVSFVDARNR